MNLLLEKVRDTFLSLKLIRLRSTSLKQKTKKYGSAYVSFGQKISYKIMKPFLEEGSIFTYKVS